MGVSRKLSDLLSCVGIKKNERCLTLFFLPSFPGFLFNRSCEQLRSKETPVVQEVTTTLREWGSIIEQRFLDVSLLIHPLCRSWCFVCLYHWSYSTYTHATTAGLFITTCCVLLFRTKILSNPIFSSLLHLSTPDLWKSCLFSGLET